MTNEKSTGNDFDCHFNDKNYAEDMIGVIEKLSFLEE
jgi:hypothetical protein